jgi:serine O-acetyltransferase
MLKDINRAGLLDYLETQLNNFYPDGRSVRPLIDQYLDEALTRVLRCINGVVIWDENVFNYLHSSQYTLFLYYLANSIWRHSADRDGVCTKLFLLNKALNGIDCFYEIEMPDIFFIGHSVGIVLAKAQYSNYLVLYQNSTVGKNHGVAPVIGSGVVLYPNTAIIGRCRIGSGTVLSQGTSVINADTPENKTVFNSADAKLTFRPTKRNILNDIFRNIPSIHSI